MESTYSLGIEEAFKNAFKVLAECYHEPAEESLSKLLNCFDDKVEILGAEIKEQAKNLIDSFAENEKQELLLDYSRLFVGPFKVLAQPFGSYYLDNRQMMGDSTIDVKEFYEKAGLNIAESFKNLPDHITAELEFLFYLVFNEVHACQEGNEELAQRFRDLRLFFTERHIGQWVEEFAANIDQHAHCSFYKELSKITCMIIFKQGTTH